MDAYDTNAIRFRPSVDARLVNGADLVWRGATCHVPDRYLTLPVDRVSRGMHIYGIGTAFQAT
jgi:hypothetical protein